MKNNTRNKIEYYIKNNTPVSISDLNKVFKISTSMIHRHINKLLKEWNIYKVWTSPKALYLYRRKREQYFLEFLNENKDLFWDVQDIENLSEEVIINRFFKFWDWKNMMFLIKYYWKKRLWKIYKTIRNKKRSDLSIKTINFLNIYFDV